MPAKQLLQICPHDSAPFGDLVRVNTLAAQTAGIEVTNVFLGPATDAPLEDAAYLNLTNLNRLPALKAALKSWVSQDWDLVLCHRYRSYWGAIRAGAKAERCIALAHEFGMLGKWQRRVGRQVYGRGVHFAGVSKPVAQELAQVAERSLVLPNAIDLDVLRAERLPRAKAQAALGLSETRPGDGAVTVGVVGRLHYKKRPDLAVAAFSAFQRDNPRARLVMVGDGDERARLQRDAPAQTFFTGNVPNARAYMNAFDILLYPAVADSFGMVVLEAMDAGVPVVTEQQHGPAYVLDKLGVYVDDASPQAYALGLKRAADLERGNYLQQAQQRAEAYFSVPALSELFHELMERGPGEVPGW